MVIILSTRRARIHKHMIHLKIDASKVLYRQLQPTLASSWSTLLPVHGHVFKRSSGASREAFSFGKSAMDIFSFGKRAGLFHSTGALKLKIYFIFEVLTDSGYLNYQGSNIVSVKRNLFQAQYNTLQRFAENRCKVFACELYSIELHPYRLFIGVQNHISYGLTR